MSPTMLSAVSLNLANTTASLQNVTKHLLPTILPPQNITLAGVLEKCPDCQAKIELGARVIVLFYATVLVPCFILTTICVLYYNEETKPADRYSTCSLLSIWLGCGTLVTLFLPLLVVLAVAAAIGAGLIAAVNATSLYLSGRGGNAESPKV
jgi:hypothetical protein